MITRLSDVCAPDLLDSMVAEGMVGVRPHPRYPLLIWNYTEKAQYSGVWNEATLRCRGLITHADTREVLARPFAKFFNHGQPGAPVLGPGPVTVTDKADGSLGVLYPTVDGWAVATRGSFDSTQARHATSLLRARYPSFAPTAGRTVLVEIVYPANRIVVDYQGLDDLVLLGSVDIATGRSAGTDSVPDWPGPVVETFGYTSLADALAAPTRANREGLVVHHHDLDLRLKVKYEDYLRLHKIVTGLTPRLVWERLAAGTFEEFLAGIPDEFHPWARDIAADLTAEVDRLAEGVEAAYRRIVQNLPEGFARKDFAAQAARDPERGALFRRLDGHDYRAGLWTRVRPTVEEV